MKHVFNFIKAIIVGFISCAIPGLSALTFAIILCIYFPLVEALSNITKNFKKSILFLIIFFIGYAIGAALAATLVSTLLEQYPLIIVCGIFGFIIGCLPRMIKEILPYVKKPSVWGVFLFVITIFLIFQLTSKASESVDLSSMTFKSYIITFLVGFLVSVSFAFPGFDYKIILLGIGFYYPVMFAIKNLILGNNFVDNLIFVGTYVAGYILGILLLSKFIKAINDRFPGHVKMICLALVLASPYMVVKECIINNTLFVYTGKQLTIGLILAFIAMVSIILLDLFASPRRPKEEVMNNRNLFKLYISSIFGYFRRAKYLKAMKKQIKDETIDFREKYDYAVKLVKSFNRLSHIEPIVEGTDKLNDEVTLYVVNHQGKYDAIGILSALENHPVSLVVNGEYFNYPYSKEILNLLESMPLDQDNGHSIDEISNIIKNGRSLVVFIQSGLVEANTLKYFKPSILEIAYNAKVKITPVLLYDSYLVYHKDKREISSPQIHFLDSIEYEDYKDLTRSELSKLIKQEMQEKMKSL